MAAQFVRVFDPNSNQFVTIPQSELADGYVRAIVPGEGEVFLPAESVGKAEFRHPPFTEDIRDGYLKPLQEAFADVRPWSIERWEDGFRRDMHPDREIAIWLKLAKVYKHFTSHLPSGPVDLEKKEDILRLIITCASNGRENVLATFSLPIPE